MSPYVIVLFTQGADGFLIWVSVYTPVISLIWKTAKNEKKATNLWHELGVLIFECSPYLKFGS